MHRRKRTFVELLTRSLAVSGLVYAVVFMYTVPSALLDEAGWPRRDEGTSSLSQTLQHPAWSVAYASRFPDCTGLAGWDPAVVPKTVVVVRRNHEVERMPLEEAFRRADSSSAADDVWTIGACG